MKFTVYETTHSYKVWKEVEAESEEELNSLIENDGVDTLGEPDDEEITSIQIDVYSE